MVAGTQPDAKHKKGYERLLTIFVFFCPLVTMRINFKKVFYYFRILYILRCVWIPPPTPQWCWQPSNPVHNADLYRHIPSYMMLGRPGQCAACLLFTIGSDVTKIPYAALSYCACHHSKTNF
jgi:hypothetical protein